MTRRTGLPPNARDRARHYLIRQIAASYSQELSLGGLNHTGMFGVVINRDVKIALHNFTDYFKGFEKVEAVREIFGDETEKALSNVKVEFYSSRRGYMGVNDEDGHIMISANYIRHGNQRDIYLDIIHELVHVKQFQNGQELFEHRWEYVDRPTEIEAFAHAVKEARRIGMTDHEIYDYLKTDYMEKEDVDRLAHSIGVTTPDEPHSR